MNREEAQEKRRERLTSERQKQILEAAIHVFSQKGFYAATTAEIAREAGVAEGTLFRYFRTKKEILLGLVAPYAVEAMSNVITTLGDQEPEEMLTAFLEKEHAFVESNAELLRLLVYEAQFHEELRLRFLDDIAMQAIGLLREEFEERQQAGEFRKDIPVDVAVNALVGMFAFLIAWRHLLDGDRRVDMGAPEVTRQLVSIFIDGIRPRP